MTASAAHCPVASNLKSTVLTPSLVYLAPSTERWSRLVAEGWGVWQDPVNFNGGVRTKNGGELACSSSRYFWDTVLLCGGI